MADMRTVVVSLYQSYPPSSGAASVAFNVAKHLGGKKYLVQLSEGGPDEIIDGGVHLIHIKNPLKPRIRKALSLVANFSVIVKRIEEIGPEIVFIEGSSWAFYHLVLFALIKRRGLPSRVCYHTHNVDFLLRKQTNNPLVALLSRWSENQLLKRCDLSFAVSEADASQFHRIYRTKPRILPNGVDIERFRGVAESRIQEVKAKYRLNSPIVLFMGLSEYPPNKEAVDFLVLEVFPEVVRKSPGAQLAVIGGKIGHQREWLINPGSLPCEEVPPFIKACDVCVAPIFSGSGTRLKILEYMAAERPVISSPKGIEGLDLEDGRNVLIASGPDEFSACILSILSDGAKARRVAKEGLRAVQEKFTWPHIMDIFKGYLADLQERDRGRT